MKLKKYLIESEKTYELRLKSIVPLDDTAMDAIEAMVAKYQPLKLSSPKKTIMQSHPVDFVNIPAAEVFIVDMTFGLPVSASVMREDIRKALNAPETFVVVRYSNEAIEIENERKAAANEIEAEAKKKKWKPRALLDTGADYPEFESEDANELYGNEYNGALLYYLDNLRKEREKAKIKSENIPFKWLDVPDRTKQEPVQDGSDFNKDIKGAPSPYGNKAGNKIIGDRKITGSVNDRKKITRLYKDKNGNRVVASSLMGGDL